MKGQHLLRGRTWVLLLIAVVLFGVHGIIFYYLSSHFALSAALISTLIFAVVIKHLGSLGSLHDLLRRRRRP
jgi:hypothetical protein